MQFEIADAQAEFEAVHRLNYPSFVEEIPRHAAIAQRRLVDRFHAHNTYLIRLVEGRLVGMLALRTLRPLSLDLKLPNLDSHLAQGGRIGEIRLLAVQTPWRCSAVPAGLAQLLERECLARALDMLIVSATTGQQRLDLHFGVEALGRLVGREGAWYQPMRRR